MVLRKKVSITQISTVRIYISLFKATVAITVLGGAFCDKTSETEVFVGLLAFFAMWEPKFNPPPLQPRSEIFEALSTEFSRSGP